MSVDDALDLLRRENFLPLIGAALTEKLLGNLGALAKAIFFFLLAQPFEW